MDRRFEIAILSESSLSKEWNSEEEELAWKHLQVDNNCHDLQVVVKAKKVDKGFSPK